MDGLEVLVLESVVAPVLVLAMVLATKVAVPDPVVPTSGVIKLGDVVFQSTWSMTWTTPLSARTSECTTFAVTPFSVTSVLLSLSTSKE